MACDAADVVGPGHIEHNLITMFDAEARDRAGQKEGGSHSLILPYCGLYSITVAATQTSAPQTNIALCVNEEKY